MFQICLYHDKFKNYLLNLKVQYSCCMSARNVSFKINVKQTIICVRAVTDTVMFFYENAGKHFQVIDGTFHCTLYYINQ